MPRTLIPLAGGNTKVAEHNLYDFRHVIPTTGNILFVDSNVSSEGNGLSPESAFSTLNEAIAAASANNGDIIYVMEGHAETIDSAADVDISKAGLTIIGLGRGGDRPTFTFSTSADGTFAIGASSTYIENLLLVANFTNGVTVGIDIDDSHSDVYLKNLELRAAAATKEFLKGITIAEGATRVTIDGCRFTEGAGDATAAVFTESTAVGLTIKNCTFSGKWGTAVLDLDDDAITGGLDIWNNYSYNSDTGAGLFATVTAATVGFFVGNRSGIGKANTVPVTDGSASVFVDNLATDAANISELKYPATATAWS
jgi:hypothetical protein